MLSTRSSRLFRGLDGWALPPLATFGVLFTLSFRRWFLPFQDSGQDAMVADRILHGEVLYRDVAYSWGPLWPHLDALALKLFGHRLESLVLTRTVFALLGVWVLYRLLGRLTARRPLAAAAASLAVATCMFIPNGGSWPYPYSGPAIAGTVWLWAAVELALGSASFQRSLLAGLVAGLAAGLKVEFLPAALLAPPLGIWWRRGRREALASAAVVSAAAAVAWVGPVALFGRERMASQGVLLAGGLPEPFLHLYRRLFWNHGGGMGEFLSWASLGRYLPSAVFLALAFAVITVLSRRRMAFPWRCAAGLLLLAYGLGGLYLGHSREIQALIPFALLAALWTAAGLLCFRARERWSAGEWAFICVGITLLPALARQPFGLSPSSPYSAFSAPLAVAFAPLWIAERSGGRILMAAFLFGLATAQAVERVEEFHRSPRELLAYPRGRLALIEEEARLVEDLVRVIERHTEEGDYVAAFPDGGMVLFLSARRSPFRHELFHPGNQNGRDEREMIETLEKKTPAVAFIANRVYPEYGMAGFGQGYLEDFAKAFHEKMVEVGRVGRPSSPHGRGVKANAATVFLPGDAP